MAVLHGMRFLRALDFTSWAEPFRKLAVLRILLSQASGRGASAHAGAFKAVCHLCASGDSLVHRPPEDVISTAVSYSKGPAAACSTEPTRV
eukprot:630320-Amphidinium_carterae.1